MKRAFIQYGVWLVLLLAVLSFVLAPIFRAGFIVTDDANWMIIRLSAFYQSLRDGQFPVRLLGRLNHSYGYPVANFLYPGFLYVGSVLHLIGFSFRSSIEIILVGSVTSSVVFLFLWLKKYFSSLGSFLGSLAFILNPYLLYDVFTRGSIGEVVAVSAFFGVLYAYESANVLLFVPMLAFLLVSHNTAALFFLMILVSLMYIRKDRSFVLPTLSAIGIAAFFWIPALLEKRFVLFDSVGVSNPLHYFPASFDLLVKNAPVAIIGIGLLFVIPKKYHKERVLFTALVVGGAFFISELSAFLWSLKPLQLFIQFPYRLFLFWLVAGSWLISYIADSYKKLGVFIAVICILWFGYNATGYAHVESIEHPEGYFSTNEATTTVANEYMPRWVSVIPSRRADKRIEILTGNAEITPIEVNTNRVHVSIDASENSLLQINSLFYPGWGAMVDDKPVTIAYNNDLGVMQIPILEGTHTLFMEFRETKSRFLADMISLFSILFFLGYYCAPVVFHALFHKTSSTHRP
jgi:hypothetical protein